MAAMNSVLFRICLANFIFVAAVFMQFGALVFMGHAEGEDMCVLALALSSFVAGLFVLGPFCSYFVARFQRKSVYRLSLFLFLLLSGVLFQWHNLAVSTLVRFGEGMLCGVAQVALGSTMLNDLTVSEKRTVSDYYFAWIALAGIPLGIAAACWLTSFGSFDVVLATSMIMIFLSILIVDRIRVPFRAPINVKKISCDRFWQKNDFLPFLNLLLFSTVFGIFLADNFEPLMLVFAAAGIFLAHPLRVMVFSDADVRAEIVTGMILVLAAMLIPFATESVASLHASALILGAGIGLSSSRFLLYFLKLIGHCQRGTAQNTYMLSRECGYAIGFVLAFIVPNPLWVAMPVLIISIVLYLAVTHPWFLKHNDRYFKFREV